MKSTPSKKVQSSDIIDQFTSLPSKIEALQFFCNNKSRILTWFNYDILTTITLSHLIDQIAYEIRETSHIKDEYIIDMLYRRAETYVSFVKGLDFYEQFLLVHKLVYDDILLIAQNYLTHFKDRLLHDFHELKSLQYAITTALLTMNDELLIPFYYDIATSSEIDVSINAIIGLSIYKTKFANWERLYKNDEFYNAMIYVASSQDISNPDIMTLNDNIYLLFLYCRVIELFKVNLQKVLPLLCTVLQKIPDNHILYTRSVESIERILFCLTHREFNHFTTDDVLNLISVFNSMPAESIHFIVQYWSIPKSDFVFTVQRAIQHKQVNIDDCSNIATLLCSAEFV